MNEDDTSNGKNPKALHDDILRRLKAHDEAVKDRPMSGQSRSAPNQDQ